MDEDKDSAQVTNVSQLPQNQGTSLTDELGTRGVIHRLESAAASVKLTGHIVAGLSDSEQEFTSSGEEYVETKEQQVDTTAVADSVSGKLEDTSSQDSTDQTELKIETKEDSSRHTSPLSDKSIKQFQEDRFNPFDRDLVMEEDHFIDDMVDKEEQMHISRLESDSSWTYLADGTTDEVTYAELGLAEDHFSHPEGHFGLSSTEELEMAIDNCKEMILQVPQDSDKQKNLVRKLIQLRMKLLDIKEGPEPVDSDVKVVVGHKFRVQNNRSTKHYCEKCNTMILGVIQTWHKCIECGYCCHDKCLNQITRTCASLKVSECQGYTDLICPLRGLSYQNYRCAECRAQISFKTGFSEPRLCDYSGNYYCELCHWNDTMPIPARILHNWDFEPRKVCRATKQFLKLMTNKAVMRIHDVNPMLFSFVEELNEVKKLREEILIMKKYLLLCGDAMQNKLLLLLKDRQHFVESWDTYSMKDLHDIQTDSLLGELAQIHAAWAQHIKTDCQRCQAKGFICELCESKEILFPFDNIAVVCSQCSNVLHRHCFAKKGAECPRCERRSKRKAN